ncbi:MAG: phenylacetate--CoA ligase [Deltaproteobacteria bacterium]|jgi:phenylacetate-CoA ligase|nr:phenylacetate--CoA ligase [Deltaproteobacteria bacterium]
MGARKHRFIPYFPDDEAILRRQLEGIRWTVRHARASPRYKASLDAAGVYPEDIKSLDDVRRLPLSSADDLRAGYPLPLLSIPERDIVRVHASSGTTDKRKILAYSRRDVDNFALQMARCYEMAGLTTADRIQIAVGYGLWTAGAGFQAGSELFGALTIPVGPGNLDIHLRMLEDLGATCFCATASMALLIAEAVERSGIIDRIKLRKLIFGSETCSGKMRASFESGLRLAGSYDIGGMTEMYGPGSSIECDARQGLHYWPDLFYMEIVNPGTLDPAAAGEVGELVVTSLCKEAAPLIRYRTRDLTRLLPGVCACGLNLPRHDKIHARSDDMFILRGVNIYPGQIMDVLAHFPELGGEYHVTLTRADGRDCMELAAERHGGVSSGVDESLAARVEEQLSRKLMVRGGVRIVDHGSLPRTVSKSKRVTDLR